MSLPTNPNTRNPRLPRRAIMFKIIETIPRTEGLILRAFNAIDKPQKGRISKIPPNKIGPPNNKEQVIIKLSALEIIPMTNEVIVCLLEFSIFFLSFVDLCRMKCNINTIKM